VNVKLAVITDEIAPDFEHALDVMAEYGVTAAELRGLWGTNIAELDPEQSARARRALKERGMTVAGLATPVYKCHLDTDEAEELGRMHLAKARGLSEQMDTLRRCCQLAHAFETRLIRVFTFWRRGPLTPEIERRIIDAFEEPVRIAEQEDVILTLENEHACYIGTGAEAARIVQAVNSPRLRVCWDPGNAYCVGEKPYPDGYEAVKPLVAHIHVKDAVMAQDAVEPQWCVIGEGDIDYAGQFDALRRDGYDGYISLETHYVPQGGTPEEGSRACLEALRRFLS
jgi:sugar phosphate isomerase/epimerase